MRNHNIQIVAVLILLIISMIMLSFAAVPIYNLFCKVTGFGGTVQEKFIASKRKGNKQLIIRFDSNVEPNLPWRFIPQQKEVTITTGENNLIFYYAKNLTSQDIIGTAVYNVTPNKAGKYFVKIYCFCYEEQILKANQEVLMPVSFYIDPEIENDSYMDDVHTITLSYSFFKIRNA